MFRWPAWTLSAVMWIALIAAGSYILNLQRKASKYAAEVTAREKVQHDYDEFRRQDAEQDAKRDAASQSYQDEVRRLQADAARRPHPVVRLCQPAPAVPGPAVATRGPETGAAPGGMVPPATGGNSTPGPDIGPELVRLMDRADALSAQTRAILQLEGD